MHKTGMRCRVFAVNVAIPIAYSPEGAFGFTTSSYRSVITSPLSQLVVCVSPVPGMLSPCPHMRPGDQHATSQTDSLQRVNGDDGDSVSPGLW